MSRNGAIFGISIKRTKAKCMTLNQRRGKRFEKYLVNLKEVIKRAKIYRTGGENPSHKVRCYI